MFAPFPPEAVVTKNGLLHGSQSPMNAAESTAPNWIAPPAERYSELNLVSVTLAAIIWATTLRLRQPMGLVNRLARLALICGALAALSFITIPVALPRAITVIAVSAISGFPGLYLLAIVIVRDIRGQRRRSWAVVAVLVAAIQVFLGQGLHRLRGTIRFPAVA